MNSNQLLILLGETYAKLRLSEDEVFTLQQRVAELVATQKQMSDKPEENATLFDYIPQTEAITKEGA